ncbi:MAG: transferase [Rivularia sp. (in: cyanobacteria)]
MSVPPLRLYNNFETFYSGEVIVHASAVIAPGVIMQAAPNSKIIIGSGVCIGMGSILQVDTGTLEIESGANLGAGFLMVGAGKIGTNACIGSATTVFRSSVEPGKVVPAGSVIGDTSRTFGEPSSKEMNGRVKPQLPVTEQVQVKETEAADEPEEVEIISDTSSASDASDASDTSSASNGTKPSIYTTPPVTPSPSPYVSPSPISYFSPVKDSTDLTPETAGSEDSAEEPTNANSNGAGNHIYGRSNVKSLLTTLFPHRQTLDTPHDESQEG